MSMAKIYPEAFGQLFQKKFQAECPDMNDLEWLQCYFSECCNGDWEHTYQIKIQTLDNPGWSVEIALEDTVLEDMSLQEVSIQRSASDWLLCRVEDKVFRGGGGIGNLVEILKVFRDWVKTNDA